jgi:putative membrane protein
MNLKSVPMLALASGLTLAIAACGSKSDENANSGGASPTATATDTGAANATAANDHAAKFLSDAVQADNAEIEFGQAAQKMGSTQGVKDFGKMLVDDHSAHKDKVMQLAQSMNVTLPTGTTAAADSELKMATSMSGMGFDKDFVTAMVKDHKAAIDMFQQEADSSDPAPVTDLAKATLPTLKKHLQTAQSLQK